MSTNEINLKVSELRELKRMAEELQAEIDVLQDGIKDHMTAAGVDEILGIDYKITWKPVTTSRIDSSALKKALPDVAAQFLRETTSRRFCLT